MMAGKSDDIYHSRYGMLTAKRIQKAVGREISKASIKIQGFMGAPRDFSCPACGEAVSGFFSYGGPDWGCPNCGASPRERFVNYCLDRGLLTFGNSPRILHMAPNEASLARRFGQAGKATYGDLFPEIYRSQQTIRVDLMDLAGLGLFDIIYASHVMEHVPDDGIVLRNIFAHIEPKGQIWILVPLHDGPTVDGESNLSARERERRFGQWDHVRQYGVDLKDRMRSAGFNVTILQTSEASRDEQRRYGFSPEDKIFVGFKT